MTHRQDMPPPSANPPNGTYAWSSYNQVPDSAASETSPVATSSAAAIQTPIQVPHDDQGIIDNAKDEPWAERARKLFGTAPALVVVRQLEMMNVLIGYEEANKYRICAPDGSLLGYLVEQETGLGGALVRQMAGTHRSFTATVLDPEGQVILSIRRPFSFINSKIFVCAPSETGKEQDEQVIGEVQQEWHIYRRRYNHFIKRDGQMVQFASTDSGFLAWNFYVQNERGEAIASINRNFTGLARELFTDTGQYVLRFEGVLDEVADPRIESPPAPKALPSGPGDSSSAPAITPEQSRQDSSVPALVPLPSLTYDQRAILLASAVSIDFDYFTRSRGGLAPPFGMFMPIPVPTGGGGGGGQQDVPAAEGAEAEGATGAGAGAGAGMMGGPGPGTLDDPTLDSDDRLPPTSERDWGRTDERDDDFRGPFGGGGDGGDQGGGGWNDEVMQDPWSNAGDVQEEGGTWGWSDLFPGDGDE